MLSAARLGPTCRALFAAAPIALGATAVEAEERRRLNVELSHVVDVLDVAKGGLEQDLAALHKLDLAFDWTDGSGFEAYADFEYTGGDEPSANLIGDAQVVSNIEAPGALRVFEAWAAKTFAGDRAGVKAGMIDLNSEFDVQAVGAVFLNSSHGVGPDFSQSGLNGPSIFPNTSLAVTGFYAIDPDWTVRAGVFDGVSGDPDDPRRTIIHLSAQDGALGVLEVERRLGRRGRLVLGGWGYTAAFDAIEKTEPDGSPRRLRSNVGAYAILEGKLWREASDDKQGLDGWVRAGFANDEINPLSGYVGGGVVYTGLWRDDDQLGLAVAHAMFGGPARRTAGLDAAETTVELTYALPVHEKVTLQPDVQWVRNPGGDPTIPDALVIGMRISWTLSN